MTQQYSLRWNNHQPNFISMFTTLLNTQTLVDVTLAAEGKHLQAHKVVLSACSTYFQALFVDNPSRHPIVILKDVTFADLRTMVDFMYYGEVNVTEEQLPQVLDTAKTLKIKGLTEMPDSTSLTRAQGTSTDFPTDPQDPPRHNASPTNSPRRKRSRRRSSNDSMLINTVGEENRTEEAGSSMDMMRADAITLSSVPQRRARNYHEDRNVDTQAQNTEQQNMNVEAMTLETDTAGMPQGAAESSAQASVRLRRSKNFKRQSRVPAEEPFRKQASEPAAGPSHHQPTLQKHESYPQYSADKYRRVRTQDPEVGTLFIRAVTMSSSASTSSESEPPAAAVAAARASHTPAVRSGPPLSCNYCWNTVDECGRILRRKTQYHCPECRTNLCIVPCFHEYHDGTVHHAVSSARSNISPWSLGRPFSPRPNRDPYSPRPLRMRRIRTRSRPRPDPHRISTDFPSLDSPPNFPPLDRSPSFNFSREERE